MKHKIQAYFIAGLLFWLPIIVTIFVIVFMVGLVDKIVEWVPSGYRPEDLLGMHIPGLGFVLGLAVLFVSGVIVTNFLGRRLVALGDAIIARIPLVRSIYLSAKQVAQTIFGSGGRSFRRVFLIEYPRKGLWTVAFQTSDGFTEACERVQSELVTVFIPTTPNPTSGFVILVERSELIEMEMSVEDALKLVVSLGVVQPEVKKIEG